MSPHHVFPLRAMGDICHHTWSYPAQCANGNICFISLNFVGLLCIKARISTQLSMTSYGKNEVVNAAVFNMFTGHFVAFEQCFCAKTDHFGGNLGANTIKYVSEMEFYIILSTLGKFEHWNQTVLIIQYHQVKRW